MAVLSVGLGVIVLDGTIVGVALPSIITDLQLNLTQAQWVNSLYAVLLAALLLSTGKIADTWGRKRAFLIGLTIFVAGSVLAGFSTSAATLISACAVQEIGAAFIMSSVLSTVNAVFRGKYRAAAFGVRSAVISGEAAVGPLAGGARDFGCGVRAVYPAEKHRDRGHLSALLDLGLFSYSTFSWGNITAGAVAIGEFAIIFALPLYLTNTLDLSTMSAGLVLAAMAVGAFSPARQPATSRPGSGRLAPCSSGSAWKPSESLSSSCL
ncbi:MULTISPECIES: MFS transporter [Corynebacterium]|uniref:MFS transporter n=1 Tax=Corynebacterium TaxID=1716 RepID=UPI0003B8531A|nr:MULTISPECIES: MFS transporter [Corynebacterium]ERS57948.1 hypothetical protein HMPREF1261_02003 [Corynebacterium sp. KPL1818]MDK4209044.1 MFS transporter [Corynebacterium accolens]MDK4278727.1 MFS transporter [Corynebacterium accolens]